MIQVLGLILAGAAAVGVVLADRVGLLVTAWSAGAVLHAGLAAAGRGDAAGSGARRALLTEVTGIWALGLAGLMVVDAAGTADLARLPGQLLLRGVGPAVLAWAGLGVLIAVMARLGLPPLPTWPVATAGAPPAARAFLQAVVHPLTALWLWERLEPWLLPGHREAALWIGCVAALLLAGAALGEPQATRRAALVGGSRWAAVWAGAAHGHLESWTAWAVAGGLLLVQLAVIFRRWPCGWRRGVLLAGVLATVPAGVPEGWLAGTRPGFAAAPATLLLHGATLLLLVTARRWWDDLARPLPVPTPRPRALPDPGGRLAQGLARLGRGPGPILGAARISGRGLARVVGTADRVVLGGVMEGVGWLALALGWLVAWSDRRGLDVLGRSVGWAAIAAGRRCAAAGGGHPARVSAWALVVVLVVALMGRTFM